MKTEDTAQAVRSSRRSAGRGSAMVLHPVIRDSELLERLVQKPGAAARMVEVDRRVGEKPEGKSDEAVRAWHQERFERLERADATEYASFVEEGFDTLTSEAQALLWQNGFPYGPGQTQNVDLVLALLWAQQRRLPKGVAVEELGGLAWY